MTARETVDYLRSCGITEEKIMEILKSFSLDNYLENKDYSKELVKYHNTVMDALEQSFKKSDNEETKETIRKLRRFIAAYFEFNYLDTGGLI